MFSVQKMCAILIPGMLMMNISCREDESSDLKDQISSAIDDSIELGQGYRSDIKKVLADACVSFDQGEIGNRSSYLNLKKDLEFDQVLDQLDIKNTIAAKIKFVDVKASLDIAKSHSATELDQSYTLFWKGTYEDHIAKNVAWSATGQKLLADKVSTETFRRFCGDEFVYKRNHIAWLMVTLKFRYQSRADKQRFSSKFGVVVENVLKKTLNQGQSNAQDKEGDLARIENEISHIDEALARRVKVFVEINQLGGSPTDALTTVKRIKCDLEKAETCLSEMIDFPTYLENYKNSLDSAASPPVHSFETKSYQEFFNLSNAPVSEAIEDHELANAIDDVWVSLKRNIQAKEIAITIQDNSLRRQIESNIIELTRYHQQLVSCLDSRCQERSQLLHSLADILAQTKAPELDIDGHHKGCIRLPARVSLKSILNEKYVSYNEEEKTYMADSFSRPAEFTINADGDVLLNNMDVTFHEGVGRGLSYYAAAGAYSWSLTYYGSASPVTVLDVDSRSSDTCIKDGAKVFLKVGGYYVRTWVGDSWDNFLFAWDSDPASPSYESHTFVIREQ